MKEMTIKNAADLKKMAEGGAKLAHIRASLGDAIKVGVRASEIEELAVKLIEEASGEASFKMVPGYSWATCVNVNAGVVHGIPKEETVFGEGDMVSVDVGLYFRGFHTDTSLTKLLGKNKKKEKMLEVGRESLKAGMNQARVGNKIGDISRAMGEVLSQNKMNAVRSLTGHGIGKELHEDPRVPCTPTGSVDEEVGIREGMTLAIEVMYTDGSGKVGLEPDGWTISTRDGRMAALFEETVAVRSRGPIILTAPKTKHLGGQAN